MTEERTILCNASLAGGLVIVIAVLIYLFLPSPVMLITVSSFFPLVLSLSGAALAYGIFRREASSRGKAVIWGAMALGLLCWAAGELIWFLFELSDNLEVPYPSAADLLWSMGYFPLVFSIGAPYVSLRMSIPVLRRRLMAAMLVVMGLLLIGLVFAPILTSPESGTPLEMLVTLVYPIGDFILLSLAIALVMVFLGGQLALSWGIIASSILLFALSDLLFCYGSWRGLYYPDGQLNFISGSFDILYLAGYIVLNIGLLLRFRLPEPGKDIDLRTLIPEQGKDFLLMADQKGRVVFLDPALLPVLGLKDSTEGAAKTFGQLFGLPHAYEDAAVRKAAKTGISDDYTICLGLSRTKYRLRAVASSDPQQFPGFDILLHPDAQRTAPDRDRETILLGQVADRARQLERTRRFSAEEDPLRVYFNTLVDLLFILVSRAGGTGVGAAFEADVNEKARQAGCKFELRGGKTIWNESVTAPGIYRDLLEEAVRYANQVISASTIGRKLEEIERFMDPAVVREAEEHRLRRVRSPQGESG